jgi:hypothetical protein
MNQRQMISRYKRNPFVTRRCKTSIAAALLAVIAACAFAQVVWQPLCVPKTSSEFFER